MTDPVDAVERVRAFRDALKLTGVFAAALAAAYDVAFEVSYPVAHERFLADLEALLAAKEAAEREPIDMVLYCPACGEQHIDEPEPALGKRFLDPGASEWTNPPHRSHLCHDCGHIWRPADVPTNGVVKIATAGKDDSPPPSESRAQAAEAKAAALMEELTYLRDAAQADYRGSFTINLDTGEWAALQAAAQTEPVRRPCTCPAGEAPTPCPRLYALSECRRANASVKERTE